MIPWKLLGKARTPGEGVELCFYQRDDEFSIKVDNYEVMNSRAYGSEEALAWHACQKIASRPRASVLIGGLGMGFTLRAALNELSGDAQVAVAELMPEVEPVMEIVDFIRTNSSRSICQPHLEDAA